MIIVWDKTKFEATDAVARDQIQRLLKYSFKSPLLDDPE